MDGRNPSGRKTKFVINVCGYLNKSWGEILTPWISIFLEKFFTDFCHQVIKYHNTINSYRASDAIWQHKFGSTSAQVMAWCLMVPGHYLSPCWYIINESLWHSILQEALKISIDKISLKITLLKSQSHCPWQWVKHHNIINLALYHTALGMKKLNHEFVS